jgi:hypothetical protein
MRSVGKSTPFGITESDASAAQTLFQQSILFLQMLDRIDLPTIDPASKQRQ